MGRPLLWQARFPLLQRYLWTPCGSLLIAASRQQGFHILNPPTLHILFHAPERVYERSEHGISWGSEVNPGAETKRMTWLVDARAHAVLGSWTVAKLDLRASTPQASQSSIAMRMPEELSHIEWAFNGMHLAAFSNLGHAWFLVGLECMAALPCIPGAHLPNQL